jgi:hypothetical protein
VADRGVVLVDGLSVFHVHALCTDGGFEPQPDGSLVFRPVTALTEQDLVRVLDDVAADLADAGALDDELDIDAPLATCIQRRCRRRPARAQWRCTVCS